MLKWINKKRKKKGFTLIELVVVIAILGILAAIAIPRFIGTLNTAKENADDATARVIQSTVGLYYAEEGEWPDDQDDLIGTYLEDPTEWSDGEEVEFTVDDNGTVTFGNKP